MGMSQEIRANYDQIDLLPQCLEDWMPADHPARFIREFVDALDLTALGFRQRESEEGRPNYAADLLLKVWLYGYLTRMLSTRELERACREHLSLLWLTGRHAPDHNTLWRFWKESHAALRQVLRAGVKVAAESGMLEEVKTNLGQVAEETVADGGYKSSVSLGEAEQRGYSVLVNWGGDASGREPGPYHKSRFRHQAEEDVVICPRGERLEFEGIKTNRGKRFVVRGYRCRNFRQCPVRAQCSRNRQGRLVEISPYEAAVAKQRANRRDPQKWKLLKKRKVIVEPVFGVIKQAWGFRRWTLRGLENVRTQWSMLCAAFNLQRMQKAWAAGEVVLA